MGEKIYHLITFDPCTNEVIGILNFHNLENAIARGKIFIKQWYEVQEEAKHLCLEKLYYDWERNHYFLDELEIAESEFED